MSRTRYPSLPLSEPLPPDDARCRQEHPYRVYRFRAGELVQLCDANTTGDWACAVETLYDDGEFVTDDCVGVKRERGIDPETEEMLPGEWIVHPYNIGRRKEQAE